MSVASPAESRPQSRGRPQSSRAFASYNSTHARRRSVDVVDAAQRFRSFMEMMDQEPIPDMPQQYSTTTTTTTVTRTSSLQTPKRRYEPEGMAGLSSFEASLYTDLAQNLGDSVDDWKQRGGATMTTEHSEDGPIVRSFAAFRVPTPEHMMAEPKTPKMSMETTHPLQQHPVQEANHNAAHERTSEEEEGAPPPNWPLSPPISPSNGSVTSQRRKSINWKIWKPTPRQKTRPSSVYGPAIVPSVPPQRADSGATSGSSRIYTDTSERPEL